MNRRIASSVAVLVFVCAPVQAQWLKVPQANIPRTPDGKPNLSAPAPRLPNGKPDLSGIWEPNSKYVRDLAADLKLEDVPFQPTMLRIACLRACLASTQLLSRGKLFRRRDSL